MSVITDTIYEQLGGHRFAVMTGAKNFMTDGDKRLVFAIGRNKTRANRVTITLRDDLYDVRFSQVSMAKLSETELKVVEGIHAENLGDVFTSFTGLYTSLRG